MFKKILAVLLVLCMLLCIVACNDKPQGTKKPPVNSETTSTNSTVTDSSEDSSSDDEVQSESKGPQVITSEITTSYTVSDTTVLDLDVYNNKVFNDNWDGVNAINQGFIFLPDEYGRNYTDAQIEEELKRMGDMNINMVRSYMDAGYAFKERKGKEIIYDWDSERMQAFYKWLDAMEERDIEVAVNMGWSNGSIAGATTQDSLGYTIPWYERGKLNIYSEMIDMYTDWVKLFIEEVIIKRGYDIEYFVMFTEPYAENAGGMSRVYEPYIAPGVKKKMDGWDVSVDVINATHKKLKEAGLRDKVKLTGPQYGLSKDFCKGETLEEELNWWIERIDDCIDVYTFHWYIPTWPGAGGSSASASVRDDNYDLWVYYFEQFVDIISKTGKPFWFDEWMYGDALQTQNTDFYSQQVAQTVIAAMNSGVNSCIYWQLFETIWPTRLDTGGEFNEGIHVLGTAPSLYESAIPYKSYYGLSTVIKHAGEFGSKVYYSEGTNGIYLSMVEYEKDGKKYQNVIVVNTGALEQKISINFEKSIGKNMYRYLFDPAKVKPNTSAEMITSDKGFKNVNKVLQDTIPAASIAVYSTVKD